MNLRMTLPEKWITGFALVWFWLYFFTDLLVFE